MDKSGTDDAKRCRKVANEKKNSGAIRFLVNATSIQLECARVLNKILIVAVLMYGSEAMI